MFGCIERPPVMSTRQLDFELPNVGAGPDCVTLDDLAAENDAVVILFQRDYYCTKCRDQVQSFADRYDEVRDRNAEVVAVLPEPADRTRNWQESYDLPYPLLADPDADVADQYDQPTVSLLGQISDFLGRMPEAVVLETRGEPEVAHTHRGSSPGDRPSIDDLLGVVDDLE